MEQHGTKLERPKVTSPAIADNRRQCPGCRQMVTVFGTSPSFRYRTHVDATFEKLCPMSGEPEQLKQ